MCVEYMCVYLHSFLHHHASMLSETKEVTGTKNEIASFFARLKITFCYKFCCLINLSVINTMCEWGDIYV
jgi:hypothetical protein